VFTPPDFHPSRPGIVAPVRIDPSGETGPTPGQARGRSWRASSRGWYVPSDVDPTHPWQRAVEASVCLPGYGGVTGWAALSWEHGRWFEGLASDGVTPLPVSLATGLKHVRAQPGIAISEERCSPRDLVVVDGLWITRSVRSVSFEMRYAASDWAAAEALDLAAYSDLVSIAELREYAGDHPGWTGIPRCRAALELAEENSWSPTEVRMRQVWQDLAGRGRPLCNTPVFDRRGHLIGVPDLLDPVAGVVGEYDGSLHLAGKQRARDVRREGRFRSHGLEYVTMVSADLPDPWDFVARLATAYSRATPMAPAHRSWTIQPPPWWTPTLTVAQRRALDPRTRERLLRHRRTA
jgi:hypothetical protein